MNAIVPFAFDDHLVRAVDVDGEPWFIGRDVCESLGLGNSREALARLDADEKGVISADTLGGAQTVAIVSEPGVYRLIFTSRKAEAERFKRWLAHEVLPALRKNGFYGVSAVAEHPQREEEIIFGVKASTLNAAARLISVVNAIYGPEAARAVYELEPRLPQVKDRAMATIIDTAQDDPVGCFRHLMRAATDNGLTVRDRLTSALADPLAARGCRKWGFAVDPAGHKGFVAFASRHTFLDVVFEATQWARDWRLALSQLSGARVSEGNIRFDGETARAVLLHRGEVERLLG